MHPRFRLPGAAAAVAAMLVCGPVAHRLLAQSFDRLQSAEIERFLTEAPIVRLGETLGGVTRSRQAVLQLEGVSHFAVWKTIDEKRTGVTSLGRAGSEINFRDTWKTEVPAYELDKLIGLKMVPAAVARTYRNTEGALIAWVDLGMSEAERLKKQLAPPNSAAWSQNMANVQLFDNLIYNIDRHSNNIWITKNWDIILIDHSRSFRPFNELRTEIGAPPLLEVAARRAGKARSRHPRQEDVEVSRRSQIGALLARRDAILARARRLVEEQGEAAVLFP